MNGAFRLPLIPVFVAYTSGIYFGHFDLPYCAPYLTLSLLLLFGIWVLLQVLKRPRCGSWIASLFFLTLGIFSIHLYLHPSHPPSHISRFIGFERITMEGVIDRIPHRSQESTHLLIQAEKIIFSDHHLRVEGPLLLFLKEESSPLRAGDRLRFTCKLYSPRGFRNAGVFSYERHLAFEQIHTIGFLSIKSGWVKIGEGLKNPLGSLPMSVQFLPLTPYISRG